MTKILKNNMKFLFITNCPKRARFAIKSGVDRIFLDLEISGKLERQGHLSTVISNHCIGDIEGLRDIVSPKELLVRVNPLSSDSKDEIDSVIEAGAGFVMLPMFEGADQVADFIRLVDGRAKTSLLMETKSAVLAHKEIFSIPGIDEVHIGLNDLHIQLGTSFMFESLVNGFLSPVFEELKKKSIAFGIGGVARIGQGKIPAELVLSEHVRLGSTAAILSRAFHDGLLDEHSLAGDPLGSKFFAELFKLRHCINSLKLASEDSLNEMHSKLVNEIQNLVK